jgi:hypothetical protein
VAFWIPLEAPQAAAPEVTARGPEGGTS